jgi:hypothetical protein
MVNVIFPVNREICSNVKVLTNRLKMLWSTFKFVFRKTGREIQTGTHYKIKSTVCVKLQNVVTIV